MWPQPSNPPPLNNQVIPAAMPPFALWFINIRIWTQIGVAVKISTGIFGALVFFEESLMLFEVLQELYNMWFSALLILHDTVSDGVAWELDNFSLNATGKIKYEKTKNVILHPFLFTWRHHSIISAWKRHLKKNRGSIFFLSERTSNAFWTIT